jgi:hypothetical protein
MAGSESSDKSRGVALALAVFLGVFGAHRFYAGKVNSGILMACTLGGLGVWYLYDCILVGAGQFRDADGRLIRRWDPDVMESGERISAEVLEELDALRHEVAELAERVDFAERLLAKPKEDSRQS